MKRSPSASPCWMPITVLLLAAGPLPAADPLRVRELRVQQVGDTTYFHVRFDAPPKLRLSAVEQVPASDLQRWRLAQLPQLVPTDQLCRQSGQGFDRNVLTLLQLGVMGQEQATAVFDRGREMEAIGNFELKFEAARMRAARSQTDAVSGNVRMSGSAKKA